MDNLQEELKDVNLIITRGFDVMFNQFGAEYSFEDGDLLITYEEDENNYSDIMLTNIDIVNSYKWNRIGFRYKE